MSCFPRSPLRFFAVGCSRKARLDHVSIFWPRLPGDQTNWPENCVALGQHGFWFDASLDFLARRFMGRRVGQSSGLGQPSLLGETGIWDSTLHSPTLSASYSFVCFGIMPWTRHGQRARKRGHFSPPKIAPSTSPRFRKTPLCGFLSPTLMIRGNSLEASSSSRLPTFPRFRLSFSFCLPLEGFIPN